MPTVFRLSTENTALKRHVSDLEKKCVPLSGDSATDSDAEESDSEDQQFTEANRTSRPENDALPATNASAPPQNGALTQIASQSFTFVSCHLPINLQVPMMLQD